MLTNRWLVLALLFAVRCGMGYQFQAVPALATNLMNQSMLSLADIGFLIGLYQAPGIALALPGGALAKRFGDKHVVVAGLALMAAGALISVQAADLEMHIAGRLVAGVGGILINVVLSKMVADWFSGKELATAMALFINSWPIGVALGMLALPAFAKSAGLGFSLATAAAYPLLALLALLLLYKSPTVSITKATTASTVPIGLTLYATLVAGLVWGLYNVAIGTILGFAALALIEHGWESVAANQAASSVLWMVAISVPIGGYLADKPGLRSLVLLGGLVLLALALTMLFRQEHVIPILLLAGIAGGLPAGAIMGLAPSVLPNSSRALGMGLFFTVFYILQLAGPSLIGRIADANKSAALAMDFGAGAALLACCCYFAFVRISRMTAARA